ncbi:hypothetical protein SAMN04488515_0534 [Cognatiyoonia koreensis]|uniref:Aggregation factor core n=1 Tax=Cognatiyoonia koreensis TaxID=364200 RepID=A0A1I0NCP7_9RHOB|nr:hypothetical protein [Cognatiyoonia koreensis]SEV98829.1 hypothetical protein SAMN04488515_0534 [Cognatiyoonia koreensis]
MIRYVLPLFMATPCAADGLLVQFQDGNPLDRFIAYNRGCPLSDVTLTLDFNTSEGGVVIDTEYGGIGTRDPAPVTLTEGAGVLRDVQDGDRRLIVDVARLPTLAAITVTLDVDDTSDAFEDARVFADGRDVAGTTVTIQSGNQTSTTILNDLGRGELEIPPNANACALS